MKFKFLFAVAALGLLATGCSNEENPNGGPVAGGEKQGVYLTISTMKEATRAGTENDHAATVPESAVSLTTPLKVAVFNQGGVLVDSKEMTLTEGETPNDGIYVTSDQITVTAGNLFFFVFANDEANKITVPVAAGTTMQGFVETVFDVAFNATTGLPTTIATDGKFLLGSLWKQTTITAAGGTTDQPKNVSLTIGRLASKVNLLAVADVVNAGEPRGKFTVAKYRLGSLAKTLNRVGDNATTNVLPYYVDATNTGAEVLVTSAKHTAAPTRMDSGNEVYNDVDFLQYNMPDFLQLTSPTANTATFYATENTSAVDASGVQYYGNTTYIQLQTKYVPLRGEVVDVDAIEKVSGVWNTPTLNVENADFTDGDGSFWVGYFNNVRQLYSKDPTTVDGFPVEDVHKYEGGLNYHQFVIYDTKEPKANVVTRNRVLRNHYYEFSVSNFKDLGSWTSDVDPKEPVPAETIVDLTVTVKNWDKVSASDVVL